MSALRREALRRVEAMRSPRAAEIVRRSELEVHEREAWESSDGVVRAVDVHAWVDGYALGLVHAFPTAHDAVVEAVSAVAPRVLGASVVDLSFGWGLAEQAGAPSYRDALPRRVDRRSSQDVMRALGAFLAASGDAEGARALEGATLRVRGSVIEVDVDRSLVTSALAALFGAPVEVRRRG